MFGGGGKAQANHMEQVVQNNLDDMRENNKPARPNPYDASRQDRFEAMTNMMNNIDVIDKHSIDARMGNQVVAPVVVAANGIGPIALHGEDSLEDVHDRLGISPAKAVPIANGQLSESEMQKAFPAASAQLYKQKSIGSESPPISGSPQKTAKGHFSIGISDGQGSPKSMSPKVTRKSRGAFGKRDRTSSPSSKDRSPARMRLSAIKPEMKEVAHQAIATSVAECARCVFAAFLWHEGLVHDAMACASFLKFNPTLTKQTAQPPDDELSRREAKLKNRHSMDLSKSLNDGSVLTKAELSMKDTISNQNETSPTALIKKDSQGHIIPLKSMTTPPTDGLQQQQHPLSAVERIAKVSPLTSPKHSPKHSPRHSPAMSPVLSRKLHASASQPIKADVSSLAVEPSRERASSAGSESVKKESTKETVKPAVKDKEPSPGMTLPVTLKHLLSFWEELTSATVNIASQQLVLPSPAPITKSRSKNNHKEKDKEKEHKGKKRRDKSLRGGRGNLFGEAAGVPMGGGERETVCDLCHGVFPHPVTYHMRQNHPGCGKHAGGQGYNSSGHYCGGWAGNCGDGGVGGSSWYLMCERCREKYMKERQEKQKEKSKKQKKKLPPLKTPKMLPPLEAHHVMKANAMFLLELASAAGPTFAGSSPMRKATRFDLPILSETETLHSQFPTVPFQFLRLARRDSSGAGEYPAFSVEGSSSSLSQRDHETTTLTKSSSVDERNLSE